VPEKLFLHCILKVAEIFLKFSGYFGQKAAEKQSGNSARRNGKLTVAR
jgi:hypothetical protein